MRCAVWRWSWDCSSPVRRTSNACYTCLVVTTGAPVAQLDRASGYEPEGRMFESCRAHHKNPHLPAEIGDFSNPIRHRLT